MAPTKQGGHQAAGLCVAICFGIGGGIIVGKESAPQTLRNHCSVQHVNQLSVTAHVFR